MMNEEKWDRLLQIRTGGRDDSSADQYRYPYEPTPYPVLERLANAGLIGKGNTLLDYGCGKGRVDRIYFFNPFSLEILRKVTGRILESWYGAPREILLFFYYPSDEYLSFLMTEDSFLFRDEIDCGDLFQREDQRERILIFELSGV